MHLLYHVRSYDTSSKRLTYSGKYNLGWFEHFSMSDTLKHHEEIMDQITNKQYRTKKIMT